MRLGTMVTPLARRRPWKVACEIVTLDHISHGRAVRGVGLGDRVNKDFKAFSEAGSLRVRDEMLDESLEIIAGLQTGHPFHICKYGLTEGKNLAQDRALVQEFSAAGATWWIEEIFSGRGRFKQIQKRITAGPPR